MTSMLASASLMQFNRLKSTCGTECTITRGEVSISPTIVLAGVDSVALSNRESAFLSGTQAVLVASSDYGDLVEPESGDIIVYTDENGDTVTAEARPASGQDVCFKRWNGSQVFRIDCKIVSREAA